jgi:hypothetical protein
LESGIEKQNKEVLATRVMSVAPDILAQEIAALNAQAPYQCHVGT